MDESHVRGKPLTGTLHCLQQPYGNRRPGKVTTPTPPSQT